MSYLYTVSNQLPFGICFWLALICLVICQVFNLGTVLSVIWLVNTFIALSAWTIQKVTES